MLWLYVIDMHGKKRARRNKGDMRWLNEKVMKGISENKSHSTEDNKNR